MDSIENNKKQEKKFFWANIGAMAILMFLVTVAIYLSLTFYTHHGNHVVVPNVEGLDAKEAEKLLDKAGLRACIKDTAYDKSKPADLILEQQIRPGTTVKYNRRVILTINSGHPRIKALPDILDGSARSAEVLLKSMGFKIGKRKLVPGDEDLVMGIEAGGQSVGVGNRISVETPIVLIVGNGDLIEVYNGNDSLDWALELEIQETVARNEQEKRALLNRLRSERASTSTNTGEVIENELPTVPSVPMQTSVQVEKVDGLTRKSSDLFK